MKRLSIFILVFLLSSAAVHSADQKKMNVVDYFLLLPAHALEADPREWLPHCGVVDLANGYISCTDDGAQPDFQVALFRYGTGRPLLALCQGGEAGPDSVYLDLFEMGQNGKM